ncbi:MFS transporter [Terrihabitans rhizophilus]|uniref:MFS transporter n=1 Tax=Terrihabitans rhizophilus TaxID=3092662 RepID=A0ABU4RT06_9HYPH|nr:MFS transporter [Terrihabitans sp. PJ23]MDX6806815.1 MFS transporter [Terrihabitans sp. PJ23]
MTINTGQPAHPRQAVAVNPTLLTAILCVCGIGVVSQLYIPIPLIGFISERYGVTGDQAALAGSLFGFPYAAAFLFFGPWSDQVGRRFVLVLGFSLLAISSLLVAFAPGFSTMLLARAVQGFCAASFSPVALAYVADATEAKARAMSVALLTTSLFLAGILGQVYASAMALHFGWEALFATTTVFYVAAALIIRFALPAITPSGGASSFRKIYAAIPGLLTQRRLLAVYLVSFLVLLGFVAFYSGLGPYLSQRFGVAPTEMIWVRAAGLPAMFAAIVVGRLLPRLGGPFFLMAGLIVAAIGFALAAVPGPLAWTVCASVVFVLGTSLMIPSMMFRINELAATGRGAAAALYTLTLFAGASVGVLIGQWAVPMGFTGFSLFMAVLYLAGLIGFRWLNGGREH